MDFEGPVDPSQVGATGSPTEGFGEHFSDAGQTGAGTGVPHQGRGGPSVAGSGKTGRTGFGGYSGGGTGADYANRGSPNLGMQRRTGRRRVVGGKDSVRQVGYDVTKSYNVAPTLQFNDVEELRGDCISRAYAQEIMEKLWQKWGLDTSSAEVMRKAEDLVFALFAMRTASPDADYSVYALVGNTEVNLNDLSELLTQEEVTRRRFARAVADDIRTYISDPDNVKLREILSTVLGAKPEYAFLAFDGSTHCSGMSSNQVMFTKNLERMNLFDTQEVRDKLGSTQSLATGAFQVNRGKGAYT